MGPLELGVPGVDPRPCARRAVITKLRSRFREYPADRRAWGASDPVRLIIGRLFHALALDVSC